MSKPILLIDCDDTIENFCEVWIAELNKKYNTNYSLDDIVEWDFSGLFPGVAKSELLNVIEVKEFWKKVRVKKNAQAAILTLSVLYDIYLVSAGTFSSMQNKLECIIKKYFWFIPESHVICCSDKWLLNGDYLVDDNPDNLIQGNYEKILFSASHNKKFNCEEFNVRRFDDWFDIARFLVEEAASKFKIN